MYGNQWIVVLARKRLWFPYIEILIGLPLHIWAFLALSKARKEHEVFEMRMWRRGVLNSYFYSKFTMMSVYRELALRAFSPVTPAVHSIMAQEKQMPALQSLVFLMCPLYHRMVSQSMDLLKSCPKNFLKIFQVSLTVPILIHLQFLH